MSSFSNPNTGDTARPGAASGAGAASRNADSNELGKFDALASRFWDTHGEFRPLHLLNPVRARFVAERATLSGARVLDVGCGGGLLAEALARAGAKVTAIDLAPGMIEVARLHAMEQKLEIDYRMVAAEAVAAAEPGSFDVVTCMEMLEHVPEPAQMIATLATLVRPGGAVFISTLNRNLKSFLLAIVGAEYVMKLIPRGTHEYEKLIRPAELARWARSAGLSVRELAGIELNPFTEHCTLSRNVAVNYLAHAALIGAGILVMQHTRFGHKTRLRHSVWLQGAIEAVGLARRNGQHHRDAVACGRKQVRNSARFGQRIAFRHIENQAVGENAARVQQVDGAVVKRVGIQLQARQSVGGKPERRGGELDGIFEIAALHLEMVRPQVHPFRPHHS